MDIQRKKIIARNQKIVAGFIILGLLTTVLFLRYEGEKLLDIAMPHQQVTYYKISELKQEEHTIILRTITLYTGKHMTYIVQHPNEGYDCNEKDIKAYE